MTQPSSEDHFEGAGTLAAMIATPLVLIFPLVAALADKAWWVVLLVGWAGQIAGGFVAAGVSGALAPLSRRVGSKAQTALFAFAVLVGVSVSVVAMVFAWMNWA